MLNPDSYNRFRIVMNWKIYNKEITSISRYSMCNFVFIFLKPIETEELLNKFIDVFNENDILTPSIFIEFLHNNNIYYQLDFKYCTSNDYKDNKHNLKIILKINNLTKKDFKYYKSYWCLYKNYYLKGGFLNERNFRIKS